MAQGQGPLLCATSVRPVFQPHTARVHKVLQRLSLNRAPYVHTLGTIVPILCSTQGLLIRSLALIHKDFLWFVCELVCGMSSPLRQLLGIASPPTTALLGLLKGQTKGR